MLALFPLLSVLALPATAHMTFWHNSMYGWNPEDGMQGDLGDPLGLDLPKDKWWFHGAIDKPPAEGVFLELPSGGKVHGLLASTKHTSEWGCCEHSDPEENGPAFGEPGWETALAKGNPHGGHDPDDPTKKRPDLVGYGGPMGSSFSIAYKSDPHQINLDDFVVISVNHTSPWYKYTFYDIPADLPPCPEGGCHCMWGWVPAVFTGGQEFYSTMYRCNVTNANPSSPQLAKPLVPRKCPFNQNNCTLGAKQPYFWTYNDEGNIHQSGFDRPMYNKWYGFADGAQNDVWYHDPGTEWIVPGSEEDVQLPGPGDGPPDQAGKSGWESPEPTQTLTRAHPMGTGAASN